MFGALIVAWALAGAVPPATALVVPIVVGSSTTLRAGDLERAAQAVLRDRVGLRVMSGEEAFVAGARVSAAEACGVDPACWSARLAPSGADLAIIVLANVMGDAPLAAVRVLELRSGRQLGKAAEPVDASDAEAVIAQRLAGLLDEAGYPRVARVSVDRSPADAVVRAVGEAGSVILDGGAAAVAPGEWLIRVERAGYLPQELRVEARSGVDTRVHVELTEERTWLESPWLWVGVLSVAVISGAAAIAASTSGGRCVCVAGPDQTCPPC